MEVRIEAGPSFLISSVIKPCSPAIQQHLDRQYLPCEKVGQVSLSTAYPRKWGNNTGNFLKGKWSSSLQRTRTSPLSPETVVLNLVCTSEPPGSCEKAHQCQVSNPGPANAWSGAWASVCFKSLPGDSQAQSWEPLSRNLQMFKRLSQGNTSFLSLTSFSSVALLNQ